MSAHEINKDGVTVVFQDSSKRFTDLPIVYTKRLVLYPMTLVDPQDATNGILDAYCDLRSHQAVMQWSRQGGPDTSREQSLEWTIARKENCLHCPSFAVQLAGDEAPKTTIGSIGCAAEFEIGYMLIPTYHNKGYATEAIRALLTAYWEFMPSMSDSAAVGEGQRQPTDHIEAIIATANTPSRNVLQKCGFSKIKDYVPNPSEQPPPSEVWGLARPGTTLPTSEDAGSQVQDQTYAS